MGPGGSILHGDPLLARLGKLDIANRGATGSSVLFPNRTIGPSGDRPPLVLIGASTGGPDALASVLAAFPKGFPAGVVIAQHIGAEFAPSLATWLGARCALPVRIVREGDIPTAGTVHIAASNDHLEVTHDLKFHYTVTPKGNPYRPSADVLFASAGGVWPRLGVAALLTGMGSDGAGGLLRLRSLGWHTIAQDESSCVVYGMPKAASEKHAASEILPLPQIGPAIAAKILGQKR
jgi:two-component system response regulator WspF